MDALPDMLLVWNRNAPIRRVRSPWFEESEVRPTGVTDTRSGDHLGQAELAASFELPFPEGESVTVRDIAPWLAALIQKAEPAGSSIPGPACHSRTKCLEAGQT
ncbi:MAG TPA: hypothetical protein VJ998_04230 [Pseudomonadales bacterium]|nr:hypothetical protein [Pseudomonadales bacterium]